MAAGFTPAKDSKYGPCTKLCDHTDCRAWRHHIAHPCRLCGKPIGWESRVYDDPANRAEMIHADCLEDSLEAGGPAGAGE